MIKNEEIGIDRGRCPRDLLQFSFADERGWIRPVASLQKLPGDVRPGAAGQCAQFLERLFRIEGGNAGGRCGHGFSRNRAVARLSRAGRQRNRCALVPSLRALYIKADKKRSLWAVISMAGATRVWPARRVGTGNCQTRFA